MSIEDDAKIVDWYKTLVDRGFVFPESYIVFDAETTGLQVRQDYIVQLGHLAVYDRIPDGHEAIILDWPNCDQVESATFRQRIYWTMDELGPGYRFNCKRLSAEGKDPVAVLDIYHKMFRQHQDAGGFFVTHNGVRFDQHLVTNHFYHFLGSDFKFDNDRLIDTGLLEKAVQIGVLPQINESVSSFHERVLKADGKDTKWSLAGACVNKYELDKKHTLRMENVHTANFDCYLTHALLEEFRILCCS